MSRTGLPRTTEADVAQEGGLGPVETIVGVATGSPDGGVAVVRVSGSRAQGIVATVVGSLPEPRRLELRRLTLSTRAAEPSVDEAMVVFMPGPHSFTGEDVVELHVHGGRLNVASVIEQLCAAGGVVAGPGDFSRRAFVHGRKSLDQLEGVAALVAARTEAGAEQARRLIAGELGREVEAVRSQVASLRAELEAHLDFPEDVGGEDYAAWSVRVRESVGAVRSWVQRFEAGRRAREGVRVVLAGPPNVGKSALFNALLGRRRALVSAEAGTTRDYVEAELALDGLRVTLVDTAGLREGDAVGGVESEGIELSREQLESADLVLWVQSADVRSSSAPASGARMLAVESKCDLGSAGAGGIAVSATTGAGLEALERAVHQAVAGEEEPWIGLARHKERAAEGLAALVAAADALAGARELELVCFELQLAERRLAAICARHEMGAVGTPVLDEIFARFCIGK